MSYPTSYDNYPDDTDTADQPILNGGAGNGASCLPDTESYHGADTDMDDAKTWNPDYSGL